MDLGLSGKVALVTGASRGLGKAIALTLAEEGMDVTIVARSRHLLEALERKIEERGRRALIHDADLREPAAAAAVVAATVAAFGRLDLLVNNAGATKRGDFLELTDADWADGFGLKFFGFVRMARAAWPHLTRSRGTIVNIGGLAGRTGTKEFTIGGTVNAAVALLTKALADRGVTDGVRVNAINPGTIETERLAARLERYRAEHNVTSEEAIRGILAAQGTARFGRPDEIGALVAVIASNQIDYLNGSVIDFDGGETRTL